MAPCVLQTDTSLIAASPAVLTFTESAVLGTHSPAASEVASDLQPLPGSAKVPQSALLGLKPVTIRNTCYDFGRFLVARRQGSKAVSRTRSGTYGECASWAHMLLVSLRVRPLGGKQVSF